MEFEWDKFKAVANLKKHGVTFDEASTVFDDPEHSADENREIIVGHSILGHILLVCFTEREADVIRVFSARPATRKERQDYEENASS